MVGRMRDVEGHGGSNNALRAKRNFPLRGAPWPSIVLRVESLAVPPTSAIAAVRPNSTANAIAFPAMGGEATAVPGWSTANADE
jgi:hypothetical protein